jgi:cell division protein FtsN
MPAPSRIRAASSSRRAGGSFVVGMVIGLVLGLAIALGVAFYLNKTPLPFIGKGRPAAGKDAAGEPGKAPPPITGMPQGSPQTAAKAAEKPKFDFYRILPGGEEPVSEKELKDAARAAKGDAEKLQGVFFIQAGSFQNPADADNQKAKIAILGFESSVEPAALPDKGTWYRVRLGPYTSLDDLNRTRRVLAQNGIDAKLVKIKDAVADKPDSSPTKKTP